MRYRRTHGPVPFQSYDDDDDWGWDDDYYTNYYNTSVSLDYYTKSERWLLHQVTKQENTSPTSTTGQQHDLNNKSVVALLYQVSSINVTPCQ